MTHIYIKNKLYILPALLFCINLQTAANTQPNTEHTNTKTSHNLDNLVDQQSLDVFNLNLIRKQKAKIQMPAGTFDSDFGRNGQGYFIGRVGPNQLFNGNCYTRAVTIQHDNKIVVAGVIDIGLTAHYPLLVRFNDNGTLDTTFGPSADGPGAVVDHQLAHGYYNAVAIQEFDQKIVAAGGIYSKLVIARRNENGAPDQSFGTNGVIRPDIEGSINAIALQKDHKIIVAGYNNKYGFFRTTDTILIRYNENGSLDTTFGTHGIVNVFRGKLSRANAVIIQEDNSIVVVGKGNPENKNEMAIARYNRHGKLDVDFGSQGDGVEKVQIGNGESMPNDVVVQHDGKIIVVGSSISKFNKNICTIIRLHKNGSLDTSFGDNGVITITPTGHTGDNAYATSVAIDNDDNIIVIGYTVGAHGNTYFSLIRFNEDGILDTAFGHQGVANYSLSSASNVANKNITPVVGAIQNDKKKLALASNYSPNNPRTSNQFAVARFLN